LPELRFGHWLALAAGVIAADFATKAWILALFRPGESLMVLPVFNLVLAFNPGAAFSFLADAGGWQKWFFVLLALCISTWIIFMLKRHAADRLQCAAFSLVLGGALGNVIDRLRFGAVVDFLQVHYAGWYWPAFNVADSAISIGVALLVWHSLTHKEVPRG
jgi:signal peptidase II